MPDLQIPTITIEDLHAFQAKHFPGSVQPPAVQYQYDESVDYQLEYGNDADDDDLGYYPDGVKRTLTDEQIEIFRHSEIHALRREKQLREEALLEAVAAPEEEEEEEEEEKKKVETVDEKKTTEARGSAASDADTKERVHGHQASSDAVLDYGEEEASAGHVRKRARSAYTSQFAGRRIISYDD